MQHVEMPALEQRAGVPEDDLALIGLQTSADVWRALQGQRLFITGGTGFVGCWLLEALLWANRRFDLALKLDVLSRRPEAFKLKAPHLAMDPSVTLVQGDMSDLRNVGGSFGMMIHAATDVAIPNQDPLAVYDAIVGGTRQALALSDRSKAQRFLYVSSGAVYGPQPPEMACMPESFGGAPVITSAAAAYGHAKRVSEWMVFSDAKRQGIDVVSARLFALIGPYLPLDAQFAIGNFIGNALVGKPMMLTGDGSTYRSYLYGADMAVWLLTLLTQGKSGEAYNVGSEQPVSIRELAEQVSQLAYGEARVSVGARPAGSALAARYVPATGKAKAELGLDQYTDLRSALKRTMAWAGDSRNLTRSETPGVENAKI